MADVDGGGGGSPSPDSSVAGVSSVLRLRFDRTTLNKDLAAMEADYRARMKRIADVTAQSFSKAQVPVTPGVAPQAVAAQQRIQQQANAQTNQQQIAHDRQQHQLRLAQLREQLHQQKAAAKQQIAQQNRVTQVQLASIRGTQQEQRRAHQLQMAALRQQAGAARTARNITGSVLGGSFLGSFGGTLASRATAEVFQLIRRAVGEAGDALLNFNAKLETARVGLAAFTKDGQQATQLVGDLTAFAATTVFGLDEVLSGTRRLLAMGIAADEVLGVFKDLSTAVAAVGAGEQGLQRIVLAWGQISAKPKLISQDLRQMAEVGVPVFEILRVKLGLTNDQLFNIGKHSISSVEGVKALREGMQELYGPLQVQQLNTYAGRLANLGDITSIFLAKFGESATEELTAAFRDLGNVLSDPNVLSSAQSFGKIIGEMVAALRDFVVGDGGKFAEFMANLPTLFDAVGVSLKELELRVQNLKFFSDGELISFGDTDALIKQMRENFDVVFAEAERKAKENAEVTTVTGKLQVIYDRVEVKLAKGEKSVLSQPDGIATDFTGFAEKMLAIDEDRLTKGLTTAGVNAFTDFLKLVEDTIGGKSGPKTMGHIATELRQVFLDELAKLGDAPSAAQIQGAVDNLASRLKIDKQFDRPEFITAAQNIIKLVGANKELADAEARVGDVRSGNEASAKRDQAAIENQRGAIEKLNDARKVESDAADRRVDGLQQEITARQGVIDGIEAQREAQKELADAQLNELRTRQEDITSSKTTRERQFDSDIRSAESAAERTKAILEPVAESAKLANERAKADLEALETRQRNLAAQWDTLNQSTARSIEDTQRKRTAVEGEFKSKIDDATEAERKHARVIEDTRDDMQARLAIHEREIDAIEDKYRAELRIKDLAVDDLDDELRDRRAAFNREDLEFAKAITAARGRGDTEAVKAIQQQRSEARNAFDESTEELRARLEIARDEHEAAKDRAEEDTRSAKEAREDVQREGQSRLRTLGEEGKGLRDNREALEGERDTALASFDAKLAGAKLFQSVIKRTQEDLESAGKGELADAQARIATTAEQLKAIEVSNQTVFAAGAKRIEALRNEKTEFGLAQDAILFGLGEEIKLIERAEKDAELRTKQQIAPIKAEITERKENITAIKAEDAEKERVHKAAVARLQIELDRLTDQKDANDLVRAADLLRAEDAQKNAKTRVKALDDEITKYLELQRIAKEVAEAEARRNEELVQPKQPGDVKKGPSGQAILAATLGRLSPQERKAQEENIGRIRAALSDNKVSEAEDALIDQILTELLPLAKAAGFDTTQARRAITESLSPQAPSKPQVGPGEANLFLAALQKRDLLLVRRMLANTDVEGDTRRLLQGDTELGLSGSKDFRPLLVKALDALGDPKLAAAIRDRVGLNADGTINAALVGPLEDSSGKLTAIGEYNRKSELHLAELVRLGQIEAGETGNEDSNQAVDSARANLGGRVSATSGESTISMAMRRLLGLRGDTEFHANDWWNASISGTNEDTSKKGLRDELEKLSKTEEGIAKLRKEVEAHPETWNRIFTLLLGDPIQDHQLAGDRFDNPRLRTFLQSSGIDKLLWKTASAAERAIDAPVQPGKPPGLPSPIRVPDIELPDPDATKQKVKDYYDSNVARPAQESVNTIPPAAKGAAEASVGPQGLGILGLPASQQTVKDATALLGASAATGLSDSFGLGENQTNIFGSAARRAIGPLGLGYVGTDEAKTGLDLAGQGAGKAVATGAQTGMGLDATKDKESSFLGMAKKATGEEGLGYIGSKPSLTLLGEAGAKAGAALLKGTRDELLGAKSGAGLLGAGAAAGLTGAGLAGVGEEAADLLLSNYQTNALAAIPDIVKNIAEELIRAQGEANRAAQPATSELIGPPGPPLASSGGSAGSPLRGSLNVTQAFGRRGTVTVGGKPITYTHQGIDLSVPRFTPVYATMDGRVVHASPPTPSMKENDPHGGFGYFVKIEHNNAGQKIFSIYAHLSKVMVSVGQQVKRGDQIGLSGSTGMSSGPHLHYEVQNAKGQAINPNAFLGRSGAGGGGPVVPGGTSPSVPGMEGTTARSQRVSSIRTLLAELGTIVEQEGGDLGVVIDAILSGATGIALDRLDDFSESAQERMKAAFEALKLAIEYLGATGDADFRDILASAGLASGAGAASAETDPLRRVASVTQDRTLVPELVRLLQQNDDKSEIRDFLEVLRNAPDTATLFGLSGQFKATQGDPVLSRILRIFDDLGLSKDLISARDLKALLFDSTQGGGVGNATALVAAAILSQMANSPNELDPFMDALLTELRTTSGALPVADLLRVALPAPTSAFGKRLQELLGLLDKDATIEQLRSMLFEDVASGALRSPRESGVGVTGEIAGQLPADVRRNSEQIRAFLQSLGRGAYKDEQLGDALQQFKDLPPETTLAQLVARLQSGATGPEGEFTDTSEHLLRFISVLQKLAGDSPDVTLGALKEGIFTDLNDPLISATERLIVATQLQTAALAEAFDLDLDSLWAEILTSNSKLIDHVERQTVAAEQLAGQTGEGTEAAKETADNTSGLPGAPGGPPALPVTPPPGGSESLPTGLPPSFGIPTPLPDFGRGIGLPGAPRLQFHEFRKSALEKKREELLAGISAASAAGDIGKAVELQIELALVDRELTELLNTIKLIGTPVLPRLRDVLNSVFAGHSELIEVEIDFSRRELVRKTQEAAQLGTEAERREGLAAAARARWDAAHEQFVEAVTSGFGLWDGDGAPINSPGGGGGPSTPVAQTFNSTYTINEANDPERTAQFIEDRNRAAYREAGDRGGRRWE